MPQVIHYQSCLGGWKPWDGLNQLARFDNRVCRHNATDLHNHAVRMWEQVYAKARAGAEMKLEPGSGAVAGSGAGDGQAGVGAGHGDGHGADQAAGVDLTPAGRVGGGDWPAPESAQVLVLGPHHTGTSYVTRALMEMGFSGTSKGRRSEGGGRGGDGGDGSVDDELLMHTVSCPSNQHLNRSRRGLRPGSEPARCVIAHP